MGKQIIVWLVLFFSTLFWSFFYEDSIVLLLLIMELLYFVVNIFLLRYLKRNIEIRMESLMPIAEKGQEIPVGILVRNRSAVPSVRVRVIVQVKNHFTGERKQFSCEQNALKNRTQRMEVCFKAYDCGHIIVSLKSFCIYDFLCLLRKTWKGMEKQSVGILPECHLLPIEVTRKTREFIAEDTTEYFDRESGDDPSEIYQVREYREKDSLRDIHWKLSAKADELLVKEHGRPKGCVVLVWLDLHLDGKKNISPVFLETAASLSMSLWEAECVHMVAWYDKEQQKVRKKKIRKEEQLYELFNQLLYLSPYQETVQAEYEEAFRNQLFSTIVTLSADGSVYVGDEKKMQLQWKDTIVWEQLYFIV